MVCCKCNKDKSEINNDERMVHVKDDLYICTACYRNLVIKSKRKSGVLR